MKLSRFSFFISVIFCLIFQDVYAQAIGGTINSYAAVTSIAGNVLGVSTTAGFGAGDKVMIIQMKGATVTGGNSVNFGNITALNAAGMYEFGTISSVGVNQITLSAALQNNYSINGYVQVVRVPRYCMATVTNTLTCPPWNGSVGGIIALECGTLILNSDINADAAGFRGGTFTSGFFQCNQNVWAGGGTNGGEKGESISDWIPGFNQNKANQANGGGGSNRGNSGGGGGGNGGMGGLGGHQWNGCGTAVDERGLGGLALTPSANRLFFGGGGGGGFRDNGQPCSDGGRGGGIIYIEAQQIICNNRIISANGGNATPISINDEGAGGGGAGGTIFIRCTNLVGNLTVRTNGGAGGSNFNVIFPNNCHGPGGGGGGGIFGHCFAAIPANVTYLSNGGAAGTINNPMSTCLPNNPTHGAQPGQNGTSIGNLPPPPPLGQPPQIQVQASTPSICANSYNNSPYQVTFSASGASTYSWSGFSNLSSPANNTAAVITVSATASSGVGSATVFGYSAGGLCPDTATVSVSIHNNPVLVVSDASLCAGNQTTLTASGANQYTWAPAQQLSSTTGSQVIANPSQSTTYTVYGFDGNCYSNNYTVGVTVHPIPQVQITAPANTICAGSNLNLNAAGANNYSWTPNQNISSTTGANVVVNPTTTTEYTVVGETNTCTNSAVFQVSVIPIPTLHLSFTSDTICRGLLSVIYVNGAMNYQWSPLTALSNSVGSQVTAQPTVTTVYQVTGSNGQCSSTAEVTIYVVPYPDLVAAASMHKICKGMSSQLQASGGMHYIWAPSGSLNNPYIPNPVASPTVNTNYTVTAVNTLGNYSCSSTKELYVEVIPKAEILGKDSYTLCSGQTIRLTVGGSQFYEWKPPAGLSSPTVASPYCSPSVTTVYSVTGHNSGICYASKTITVTVHPRPTVNAGRDTVYNLNEEMYLMGSGSGTLTWQVADEILCLPCPTTQILANHSKCFVLKAVNEFGCTQEDEVCVTVTQDHQLYIPNSFTPNGDGINDVFMLYGYGLLDAEWSIFDRWGHEIFHAKGFQKTWDGTFRGEPCKEDVYVLKAKVKVLDGRWINKTGHVTLLR